MNEAVSIIVLNYNGKRFLKECFTSLLEQSYNKFEIIFFDNNSSDDSVKFVKDNFTDSKIKIIESPINLGFAGGNNEALKYCTNDLIVLVNNDVKTDKDWLKLLVEEMEEKNTIASSYVITEGVNPKYYESNGSVSFLMYNVMNIFENIEDEFYPNGCSVIFRKSEIGEPFDSDYFYYSEDLYLGLKARFMGIKIKFVKDSVLYHYGGGSRQAKITKTFYQERNRQLNLFTFFSFGFLIRIIPIITFTAFFKLFVSIFKTNISFWGILKAYLWILFHIPTIIEKRNKLNSIKKVKEKDVFKYMTSKLVNHENIFNRFVNNILYSYSRLVGIKPIEYYQKHSLN